MAGTITEKELVNFLKVMRDKKKKKCLLRYHIYAVVEQLPEDSSSIDEVIEHIKGYGSADIIHVEVVDENDS